MYYTNKTKTVFYKECDDYVIMVSNSKHFQDLRKMTIGFFALQKQGHDHSVITSEVFYNNFEEVKKNLTNLAGS